MHVHFNLKKNEKHTWPLRPGGRADVGPGILRRRRRRHRRGCRGHILLPRLPLAEVQGGTCPHPGAVPKQNKCFFRHVSPNQNSSVASQSEDTSARVYGNLTSGRCPRRRDGPLDGAPPPRWPCGRCCWRRKRMVQTFDPSAHPHTPHPALQLTHDVAAGPSPPLPLRITQRHL